MAKQIPVKLQYVLLMPRIFCSKIPRNNFSISRSRCLEPLNTGKKFHSQDEDKNVMRSPLGEMKIPEKLFHEVVIEYSSVWGRKTAVRCGRSGRKYSFRQLRDNSKALAAWFQNKFKISKGDIVAVILRNCPEYPIIFLAISLCGGTMTPVNPFYTPFEIKTQLTDVRPKLIFTNVEEHEKCAAIVKGLQMSTPIVILKTNRDDQIPEGAVDLFELFDARNSGTLTPVEVHPQDIVAIPFSSGTSGTPKGVALSHKNLVSNLIQLGHPDTSILFDSSLFQPNAVLGILPMCHIFGLVIMTFFTLKEGAHLVVLPSFEPREFVKTMYLRKINILYTVPPLISFLSNKAILPKYLKRLKYIVNGAARYSPKDAEVILSKAEQVKIVQGYGMTETSPVLTHTYSKRIQKLPSIGIPIASTKLKVVSLETGEALPARKEGELYAYGPQVMKGYYEKPEETKKTIDEKGWLKTGDMAYYDEDGDFYIVERVKLLIKVSGFQVAPAELEETLKIHPKIQDAVVVGVPHPKTGEAPKAYIITAKKDDMTAEEVNKFMSEKLSSYKQLKGGIVFVEEFPKTHTGKVLREELKKIG